jgi:hypothetical protein
LALRMRVSMSAMGSVIICCTSPTCLCHTRNFTRVCHFTETNATESELAEHRTCATTTTAAGVTAHLVLGLCVCLINQRFLSHCFLPAYFLLPPRFAGPRFFCTAGGPPSLPRLKGNPYASSNALPCSFVFAVVTMVMSMPRCASILS